MSTLTITQSIQGKTSLIRNSIYFVKSWFVHSNLNDFALENLSESPNLNIYSVIMLENKWVKGIARNIRSDELLKFLPPDFGMHFIDSEIEKRGICIISKRKGLFSKLEFQITGIWDY